MVQKELSLGILAHVDAGKTSLTERLLYEAGVIGEVGSVDAGTTQTDSLLLERERGITIRSAVTSFALGDVHVNLIDTPGHPDFIAEVERVLGVLDGAVLVVSAVEGVQPQTRILVRALQRLRIPTLACSYAGEFRGGLAPIQVKDPKTGEVRNGYIDQKGKYGDSYDVGYVKPGEWHELAERVTQNSPDKADGSVEVWLDGKEALKKNGLRLRDRKNVKIDKFYFSTFYGGGDQSYAPPSPQQAYFDGFTVTD